MKKIFFALACVMFLLPVFTFAQTSAGTSGTVCQGGQCTYTPLEPLPCPPGVPNCQSGTVNFPVFLSTIFKLLISIGGLFAVVMLVVAGIGYMLSESMGDIDKAKSRAKSALWGLLLLTSSWLILNAINPALLQFDLTSVKTLSGAPPSAPAAASPSAPIGSLTLEGDVNSPENKQRWDNFVNECWYGNGGKPSQEGAVLTCNR